MVRAVFVFVICFSLFGCASTRFDDNGFGKSSWTQNDKKIKKAMIGQVVNIETTVNPLKFEDETNAEIKIFANYLGSDIEIDNIQTKVHNGKISAAWKIKDNDNFYKTMRYLLPTYYYKISSEAFENEEKKEKEEKVEDKKTIKNIKAEKAEKTESNDESEITKNPEEQDVQEIEPPKPVRPKKQVESNNSVELKIYGFIKHILSDENGNACPNQNFTIYRIDGKHIKGKSDANGRIKLEWLELGKYSLGLDEKNTESEIEIEKTKKENNDE